jgi:hypothetical protein
VTPGSTRTGAVLEAMILPALEQGGYEYDTQVRVGLRPTGRVHVVDVVAKRGDEPPVLVSLKWQQVAGTAEQKVPFEVICLIDAIRSAPGAYGRAYLVERSGVRLVRRVALLFAAAAGFVAGVVLLGTTGLAIMRGWRRRRQKRRQSG